MPFRDFEERSTPAAHDYEADQFFDIELDHTTPTSGGTVPNSVVDGTHDCTDSGPFEESSPLPGSNGDEDDLEQPSRQ